MHHFNGLRFSTIFLGEGTNGRSLNPSRPVSPDFPPPAIGLPEPKGGRCPWRLARQPMHTLRLPPHGHGGRRRFRRITGLLQEQRPTRLIPDLRRPRPAEQKTCFVVHQTPRPRRARARHALHGEIVYFAVSSRRM